jgi:ABC-type multidrug transport system ATPase subunit
MADIKLTNLNKSYGAIHILKDVNLDIKSGEFSFSGPSGCGKSTLRYIGVGQRHPAPSNRLMLLSMKCASARHCHGVQSWRSIP